MPRIDAIRQISVTEQTYYRWKKKYGGMGTEQPKAQARAERNDVARRLRETAENETVRRLRNAGLFIARADGVQSRTPIRLLRRR